MRRVPEDRRQAGCLSYDGSTLSALHSNCIVPAEGVLPKCPDRSQRIEAKRVWQILRIFAVAAHCEPKRLAVRALEGRAP